MKFPIYDIKNLAREQKGESYYNSDFAEFVENLLGRELLENDVENGIAAKVSAEGTYALSEKQSYHLQKILNRYNYKRCSICGNKILLYEVLYVEGGLCSYHLNQSYKD